MMLAAAAGSSALEDTDAGLMAAAALTLPGFSRTGPGGLPCMPTQCGAAEAPQHQRANSRLQPLIKRAITLGAWGLKGSGSPGLPIHKAHAGHQPDKAVLEQQQAAPAEGPQEQQDGSSDSDSESEGASEGEGPGGNAAASSRLRTALDSRPHSLDEAARLFMQRIAARRVLQVSDVQQQCGSMQCMRLLRASCSDMPGRTPWKGRGSSCWTSLHGRWPGWDQSQRAALEPHPQLLLTAHSATKPVEAVAMGRLCQQLPLVGCCAR